jgi:hypothetical protein
MSKRARDGALLDDLMALNIPLCRQAESQCPRRGPGRRPLTPDWVLTAMIMVVVMLKKKTKSAQWLWWREHAGDFARWFPGQHFPGRSSYFDRYRRAYRLLQAAIEHQGRRAVADGWADCECAAGDKSLIEGRGPRWDVRDRRAGRRRRGVDPDTAWGYSTHDGWVHGYSFEVVVTAALAGPTWVLLASADTASRSEQKSIRAKIPRLPEGTKFVLLDAGYDSNDVGEAVEGDENRRTGRRLLCPEIPRPNCGKRRQPHNRETRDRQRRRRLRARRRQFFDTKKGRRLYRRRMRVEPFHAQLKHLFELEHRVWHRGLDNNRTMILAAISAYQLLLTYNHQRDEPRAHLQRLLDAL